VEYFQTLEMQDYFIVKSNFQIAQ